MLAVYIQYKYIYITKCQLNLLIGIGYILPTFGEDAQGRGMYIFNIWICIVCLLPTFGQYMSVEFINWRTTVRSYSLVADNCKILQFFHSSDSFLWQLSMAYWQLVLWQLSPLTVVPTDSCPLWQLSPLTEKLWQLSANQNVEPIDFAFGLGLVACFFFQTTSLLVEWILSKWEILFSIEKDFGWWFLQKEALRHIGLFLGFPGHKLVN